MKNHKQFIILFIIFFISISMFISWNANNIKNMVKKYDAQIGKKFILENDTLIIINYSLIEDNFTLSNGKIINSLLVFNKKYDE